jgi:ABC-type Fe3+-siderophore transport system permease subunit
MRPISQRYAKQVKSRLVSVSKRPNPNSAWDAAGISLVIGVVAAVSVALRTMALEESASDRTQLLVLIALCGAFLATLPFALLTLWLAQNWNRFVRAFLAALLVAGAFIPATMFCFAFENRIIKGHIEADSLFDLRPVEVAWSMFGAMGMFTPTGLRYLAPWPVLAVFLTAALCFFFWPQKNTGPLS